MCTGLTQVKGFYGDDEAGFKAFMLRVVTLPQGVIVCPNDGKTSKFLYHTAQKNNQVQSVKDRIKVDLQIDPATLGDVVAGSSASGFFCANSGGGEDTVAIAAAAAATAAAAKAAAKAKAKAKAAASKLPLTPGTPTTNSAPGTPLNQVRLFNVRACVHTCKQQKHACTQLACAHTCMHAITQINTCIYTHGARVFFSRLMHPGVGFETHTLTHTHTRARDMTRLCYMLCFVGGTCRRREPNPGEPDRLRHFMV